MALYFCGMYDSRSLPVKEWAEEERPREKFIQLGRHSMSDTELLAILLGSGTQRESAVDLARRLLSSNKNSLHNLGKLDISDLVSFSGIGPAKAVTLLAAFELGRRRGENQPEGKVKITSSQEAFRLIRPHLTDLHTEEFWIVFLNRANMLLRMEMISQGGMAGTVVDPKIVFRQALNYRASGIILFHNHPSGHIHPSVNDNQLTKKLVAAGSVLDIAVLDHLIIGDNQYFSFADNGELDK